MLKRKQTKAIQKFIYSVFKQFWQLSRNASRKLSRWLARNLLNIRYKRRYANAKSGFVLPTVTVLLLVVALVIGAILFRTGSRTNQVIGQRDEQVIYNAATPAIERAKAKIEYLFRQDDRRPSGVPSEGILNSMMLNDGTLVRLFGGASDPYTYTGGANPETRKDINGDGILDNAWYYEIDVDGDGTKERVAYAIFMRAAVADAAGNVTLDLTSSNDTQKARNLVVRNGPINTTEPTRAVCRNLNLKPEAGWYPISSAALKKTFQVVAVVLPNPNRPNNRTITTIEFQQERQVDKGNKWGVWYRYDLDIFPGDVFNWNGAMHTEGSLMLGDNNFTGYLISDPDSCVYDQSASEITITENPPNSNFVGAIVANAVGNTSGTSKLHIHGNPPITTGTKIELKSTNDATNNTPLDVSLNPLRVFTEDGYFRRNTTAAVNKGSLNPDLKAGRIRWQSETSPYVDDTYRADDRYGPKPKYGVITIPRNGDPISAADRPALANNIIDPADPDLKNLGLDGYWERRASASGLRVIVGERLELGNLFGWDATTEPLYPGTCTSGIRCHEAKQRRTLRDNPTAVQATAIYHVNAPATQPNTFPMAFVATVSHPGTQDTITRSTTFNRFAANLPNLYSNFLTGDGTNGWEYEVVPGDGNENETTFRALVSSDTALKRALQNLANFAGDYVDVNRSGAFPPTQEAGVVHPHPVLTMWGNFSNLRRAITLLNSGGYDNLSIADKSYIQTAAGTLGMLAYNIRQLETYTPTTAELDALNNALASIPNSWGADTGIPPTTPATPTLIPDDYIRALEANVATQAVARTARLVNLKEQIARDRRYGFATSPTTITTDGTYNYKVKSLDSGDNFKYARSTTDPVYIKDDTATTSVDEATLFNIGCDVSPAASGIGKNYFGFGAPAVGDKVAEKRFIRLAATLCSINFSPTATARPSFAVKFPSLYYIFPDTTVDNHNHSTSGTPQTTAADLYISDAYIASTVNASVAYRTVDLAQMMLRPKQSGNAGCGDLGWCLPTGTGGSNPITAPTGAISVPFLDKGIFNGREMMSVRVLDIDLNMLRNTARGTATLPDSTSVTETLLPVSGIVYGFREDAVREDAIARPLGAEMNAYTPTDPALTANGISTKPVDYYPDPDRRPHGFRLRRGADLRRLASDPVRVTRGLTFVSDNPVYIQGDFNVHSTDGTASNRLEEFTQRIDPNNWAGTFYNRTDLDTNFAQPANDTWRPSEIMADAVTILSNSFADGDIDRGIRGVDAQSYRGMNRPIGTTTDFVREDSTLTNTNLPIRIARGGNPGRCSTTPTPATTRCTSPNTITAQTNDNYVLFNTPAKSQNDINNATETTVNATIVQGLVPFRDNQNNGGFHNFPRFIEDWAGARLNFTGSFVQLSFSTYATGPFDQDAWEAGATPAAGGAHRWFYEPPQRAWGYDVALQLAPAGPLAQRFVTPGRTRSEFYREPRANDAYICQLRMAVDGANPQTQQACQ
ncbi:hormogonium polysaccharide biosynthesis protein HpsA [Argonema antarcticum]|uniref:hormogonium polysaccharide biosynthesis protein HpsA n=1 Tax=Argonema antarcticum TaxID=2942763 RepID=UPI002011C453|nr:hormogonium polysaccharide biosynthesis protein HpsA [Argonema antarcticum]MCL1471495.1 hormogonium polysaccharide biosynthesis protein HpsA [Argonema antarcticum A004/B2]